MWRKGGGEASKQVPTKVNTPGRRQSGQVQAMKRRPADEEDSDDLPRNSKTIMPDMAERRQDFEFHGDAPEAFEGQHSYATFVHRHHYPERFDGESIASGSRNSQMEYDDQYVYEVKGDVEKAISFGEST